MIQKSNEAVIQQEKRVRMGISIMMNHSGAVVALSIA